MSNTIAFSGKGGTGKTTTSALFIRKFIRMGKRPLLAVDADPNHNLGEALGIAVDKTIGKAREQFFNDRTTIPQGMPKEAFLEIKLSEVIIERKDFDLIVMGRQEGPGCYCYINNILRHFLDTMIKNYPILVVDNEAGMEHLSRRTTRSVDHMFLISDHSEKGIRAIERILGLIDELGLSVGKKHLIINRAPVDLDQAIISKASSLGVNFAGAIPNDDEVAQFDLEKKSFLDLGDQNPAVLAVDSIFAKAFE